MLKRINDALPGLVLGILLYGVVIQFTGMWFAEDKLGYTIGLWYGILPAGEKSMKYTSQQNCKLILFPGEKK